MATRQAGYTNAEDVHLCEVYIEISQDPIKGVNQSGARFWSRVEEAYNKSDSNGWTYRNGKSLKKRVLTIEKDCRKLNGCIRQIENCNPSGASEQDILDRAKTLLGQDPNYQKGFKFDHVWNMVKNFEKFKDNVVTPVAMARKHGVNFFSSESDNPTPESQSAASPGLSQFTLNLDDDIGTSFERPTGVKKAKLKKKKEESIVAAMDKLQEDNRQLMEILKKSNADKMAMKEFKQENKILTTDLSTISDPHIRAYIQSEQARIMQKRGQFQQPPPSSSNPFGNYFNNLGGNGDDIPDY